MSLIPGGRITLFLIFLSVVGIMWFQRRTIQRLLTGKKAEGFDKDQMSGAVGQTHFNKAMETHYMNIKIPDENGKMVKIMATCGSGSTKHHGDSCDSTHPMMGCNNRFLYCDPDVDRSDGPGKGVCQWRHLPEDKTCKWFANGHDSCFSGMRGLSTGFECVHGVSNDHCAPIHRVRYPC